LIADTNKGVECRHRILKNHRGCAPTQSTKLTVRQVQNFLAIDVDMAAGFARLWNQPQTGQGCHRFATARLPHQANYFSTVYFQRTPPYNLNLIAQFGEGDAQLLNIQN